MVGAPGTSLGGLAFAGPNGERTCAQRLFNRYVVFLFICFINLITYYDRGAIAALLLTLQDDFNLSTTEGGALGSAFMVGFMLVSPIFAQFVHTVRPTYLLFIGLMGWTGAAVFTGSAHSYPTLVLARALIGVGEASFCGISPTMVDDIAPPKQRTLWLAIFFAAIPVGAAFGFLGAGLITKTAGLSWRWVFYTEAMAMAPFAIGILFVPYLKTSAVKELTEESTSTVPPHESQPLLGSAGGIQDVDSSIGGIPDASKAAPPIDTSFRAFCADVWVVLGNPIWLATSLGYGAYTFVLGGLSFWAPTYLQKQMDMPLSTATFYIGAITVFCGLVGTFVGGGIVDALARRSSSGSKGLRGTALQLKWCILYALPVMPLGLAAFASSDKTTFFGCLAACQLCMFAVTGPINGALLSCVPEYYRTLSMAMSIFVLHSVGDMPSPVVIGAVIHRTGSYRDTMLMLMLWFTWVLLCWAGAWILAGVGARRAAAAQVVVMVARS